MIKISYYLLNPRAKYTTLYFSLTDDEGERMRFSAGRQYDTEYFNQRHKKGKQLIRRSTELTLDLKAEIDELSRKIRLAEKETVNQVGRPDLKKIKERFYQEIGLLKAMGFFDLYKQYIVSKGSGWSTGTSKIYEYLHNHLKDFEAKSSVIIKIEDVNWALWVTAFGYSQFINCIRTALSIAVL